ncbi:hypothetical protein BGZ67_006831 [Mortierella alpina]|nr:hypothetical protein BGZ67_006831 [Mortierella alpina]
MEKPRHKQNREMTSSHSPTQPPLVAPMWGPIAIDPSKVYDLPSSSSSTPSGTAGSKNIPFWVQHGIVPFVTWLANAKNHIRFNKNKAVSGETTNEMLDKLHAYVKDNNGIECPRGQVKGKIQYAKKKYDAANKLRTTAPRRPRAMETQLSSEAGSRSPPPPPHEPVRLPGDTTLEMESDPETDDIDEFDIQDDYIIVLKGAKRCLK